MLGTEKPLMSFLLVTTLLTTNLKINSQTSESNKYFVVSSLSYLLQERGIGVDIEKEIPEELVNVLSGDLQLAAATGTLLVLPRPRTYEEREAFNLFRGTMKNFDFKQVEENRILPGKIVFYPRVFTEEPNRIDDYIDTLLGDRFIQYTDEWLDNKDDIEKGSRENNEIRSRLNDQVEMSKKLDAKTILERHTIEFIEREIGVLDTEYQRLDDTDLSILFYTESTLRTMPRNINSKPATVKKKDEYLATEDYQNPVFKAEGLAPITAGHYDEDQVPTPYLHGDLLKAYEGLRSSDAKTKEQLKSVGIVDITIVSAARTPNNQAAQKNPIAAGILSPHGIGMGLDITNKANKNPQFAKLDMRPYYFRYYPCGNPKTLDRLLKGQAQYGEVPGRKVDPDDKAKVEAKQRELSAQYENNKENYTKEYEGRRKNFQEFNKILAGFGLSAPHEFDPNHLVLSTFLSPTSEARLATNRLRARFIKAFFDITKKEREVQRSKMDQLENEKPEIKARVQAMSAQIKAMEETLNQLEKKRQEIENEKSAKQNRNETKKRQIEAKREAQRRKTEGNYDSESRGGFWDTRDTLDRNGQMSPRSRKDRIRITSGWESSPPSRQPPDRGGIKIDHRLK